MQNLGNRMKANYEQRSRFALTRRVPVIIRVDGRTFHTVTRGCKKPFDNGLMQSMIYGARAVLNDAQGAKLAYVQSDEASFLLTDYDNLQTQAWFDYNLCKIVSISASVMTQGFIGAAEECLPNLPGMSKLNFDSRAFNLPESDIANYFVWRAKDWKRNSLQMYAHSFFSHQQMNGRCTADLHEMLHHVGRNWTTDLTEQEQNGTFIECADSKWVERYDVRPCFEDINLLVEDALP